MGTQERKNNQTQSLEQTKQQLKHPTNKWNLAQLLCLLSNQANVKILGSHLMLQFFTKSPQPQHLTITA